MPRATCRARAARRAASWCRRPTASRDPWRPAGADRRRRRARDDDGVVAEPDRSLGGGGAGGRAGRPARDRRRAARGAGARRGADAAAGDRARAPRRSWCRTGAVQVLDLADSRSWRAGHVPGARRLGRGRIADGLAARAAGAALCADLRGRHSRPPRLARGGGGARPPSCACWPAARPPGGRPACRSRPAPAAADDADDVYLRPYDRPPEQIPQAMRDYLQWETALLPQLERDGTLRFARILDREPAAGGRSPRSHGPSNPAKSLAMVDIGQPGHAAALPATTRRRRAALRGAPAVAASARGGRRA